MSRSSSKYDPQAEPYAEFVSGVTLDDQQLEARRALDAALSAIEHVIEERPEIMGLSVMLAYVDPARSDDPDDPAIVTFTQECGLAPIMLSHHMRMAQVAMGVDPNEEEPMK